MQSSDLHFLNSHPMDFKTREYLSNTDLTKIVYEEWSNLHAACPSISDDPSINIYFDDSLVGTNVLAWASQTLVLDIDLLWKPSLIKPYFNGYDITIGVNPNIPNGWFSNQDCSAIGYRYDLRTVLKHELIHGLSIASSLQHDGNTWSVGHITSGACFPRFYDTRIKNELGESIVSGCSVPEDILGKDLYVGGVKLYNPSSFVPGSSLSHHDFPGHIMYYALPSRTCMNLSKHEFQMLAALDVHCNSTGLEISAGHAATESFPLFLSLLLGLTAYFY